MKNATRSKNLNAVPSQFEALEDRRLMSKVGLVDGMLVLQGNANGNNKLTVSADPGGKTVYARANDVKKHYLLKDIQRRHFNAMAVRCGAGQSADSLITDILAATPDVIAAVQKNLPKRFPQRILDPILTGLSKSAKQLEAMPAT